MAGTLEVTEELCWMPAGWVFDTVLEYLAAELYSQEPALAARLLATGYTIGHAGSVTGRGRFVYLLTEGHPGTIVELFDMSQGRDRVFAGIAAAAHHWDGRDPIRTTLPTG